MSIVWSVLPDNSWDYLNRGLAYLAFLVLGLFLAAIVPRAPRATASALAVLVACVIAYALLAKGIPSLYPDYGRLARLRSPVGFWNALALLGDFAVVLGLWRAADRRFDGALLVFGGVLTVLLAYSRGGILVGVVAVAAWLWLDARRLEALAALVVGGAAAVAVFGVSLALHGVSDDGRPHSARAHDGGLFLLVVVVAALVVASVARRIARIHVEPDERRRATLALFAVVGVACVAGVVVAALNSSGATSASAAGAHCTQGAARFGCGSSDERLDWWGQAWAMFERRPIGGTGAASFELAHRLRRAEFVRPTTEPHNFALQSLGETGIVGCALFAAAVVLGGDRRTPPARRRRRGRARGLPARLPREHPDRHRLGLRRGQRACVSRARRAVGGARDAGGTACAHLGARRARARRDGVPVARRAEHCPSRGGRVDRERKPGARGAGSFLESTRGRSTAHRGGPRGASTDVR